MRARSARYMDVHKDSITIVVLPGAAKAPTRLGKVPNEQPKLKKWMDRIARDGEIQACDEASGAGYVLHRALRDWGYACAVIAPSLIPKRAGVHRKHDTRDAADLARLHRAGELVLGTHPERGGRARAGCGALPGDVPARDPQVATLYPEVPGDAGLRVPRGNELVHAASEVVAAADHGDLPARTGGSARVSRVPCGSELRCVARQVQRTLYVTARQIPIHFVLADVPTGKDDDLVCRDNLVDERVWKAMEECTPHLLIVAHRGVHLRVQAEKADRRVELGDEGASEARNTTLVPATGFPDFCTCLRPEAGAQHGYFRAGFVRCSSAS
ncbi:hypothetical protein BH09GEM1_BH09GEM1_05210 [soil metagenome]